MYTYILKRLFMLFPTLFGAAILIFILLRLVPGDVCQLKFGGEGSYADPQQIADCQDRLGLSDPIYIQFLDYVAGFATFDFGVSMWTNQPVVHEIAIRFELSLQIAIMATLVSVVIALPLGILAAAKQNTWCSGHLAMQSCTPPLGRPHAKQFVPQLSRHLSHDPELSSSKLQN